MMPIPVVLRLAIRTLSTRVIGRGKAVERREGLFVTCLVGSSTFFLFYTV